MLCTLCYVLGFIALMLLLGGVWYKSTAGRFTSDTRMDGKTVIITGASAGIGKSTAYDLAARGARVILACRNMDKAQAVADDIITNTGNKNVVVRHLELSDLESVRSFAKKIHEEEESLHVLLNNAGIIQGEKKTSKQGYELTFATNHLGHFLLTNLLLDLLKKTAPSRIINVSSLAHKWPGLEINDLQFKKRKYVGGHAYAQSKLCNVLFTRALHRKLLGYNITVNALHPGVVSTEIASKSDDLVSKIFLNAFKYFIKDSDLGAQTNIYLSASEDVAGLSGKYFVDCKVDEISESGMDEGLAKKLWEMSEDMCGLQPYEKQYWDDQF